MATRACPNCGSQYVASVRRCIDCDVVLVDEADPDAPLPTASPIGEGDQIGYELEGWGNQLKVTLDGMLDRAGIKRVWESGALVVPAAHEEEVDQLVATVEGGEVMALDEDGAQVAFEIEGLRPEELDDLDARLIAAHIAHAWDDAAALLVSEDDEDAVAAIIDEVMSDGTAEHRGDGLAATQALSDLYVAVDRLVKDPTERRLADRYITAAAALDGLGVPYGLAGADWQRLVDEASGLADDVRPPVDEDDDDENEDEAVDEPGGDEANDEANDETEDGTDTGDAPVDGDESADHDAAPSSVELARERARALRTRLHDFV